MKNFALLLVALLSAVAISCDDETTSLVNSPQTADGEWHLVQVTGSIAGVNDVFEPATITWTFNEDGTVDVINTNTNAQLTDFFETGTYNFLIMPNEDAPEMCPNVMMIENMNFGCQSGNEEELLLTNTWADGYQLRFIKMD